MASSDDEVGLAQLVRLSRQSANHGIARVEPATAVTVQIRVTRPIPGSRATSRASQFDATANLPARRSQRAAHGLRPGGARVAATAFGLVAMLLIVGVAGTAAYSHWTRPPRHVGAVQAVVIQHVNLHTALLSTTPSAITYQVPVATFTLAIKVTHPCWVVVKSPPDAISSKIAETLSPSSSPLLVTLSGSASVTFAAQVVSMTILSGSQVLGVISNPSLGPAYTFLPAKT